jgi:hypothetical protein
MTPPRVRTVNALSEHQGEGTTAFFRALSEADDFVHARDERDELRTRVQELEASDRALVVAEQRLDAIRREVMWAKGRRDKAQYRALDTILAILDSDDTPNDMFCDCLCAVCQSGGACCSGGTTGAQ